MSNQRMIGRLVLGSAGFAAFVFGCFLVLSVTTLSPARAVSCTDANVTPPGGTYFGTTVTGGAEQSNCGAGSQWPIFPTNEWPYQNWQATNQTNRLLTGFLDPAIRYDPGYMSNTPLLYMAYSHLNEQTNSLVNGGQEFTRIDSDLAWSLDGGATFSTGAAGCMPSTGNNGFPPAITTAGGATGNNNCAPTTIANTYLLQLPPDCNSAQVCNGNIYSPTTPFWGFTRSETISIAVSPDGHYAYGAHFKYFADSYNVGSTPCEQEVLDSFHIEIAVSEAVSTPGHASGSAVPKLKDAFANGIVAWLGGKYTPPSGSTPDAGTAEFWEPLTGSNSNANSKWINNNTGGDGFGAAVQAGTGGRAVPSDVVNCQGWQQPSLFSSAINKLYLALRCDKGASHQVSLTCGPAGSLDERNSPTYLFVTDPSGYPTNPTKWVWYYVGPIVDTTTGADTFNLVTNTLLDNAAITYPGGLSRATFEQQYTNGANGPSTTWGTGIGIVGVELINVSGQLWALMSPDYFDSNNQYIHIGCFAAPLYTSSGTSATDFPNVNAGASTVARIQVSADEPPGLDGGPTTLLVGNSYPSGPSTCAWDPHITATSGSVTGIVQALRWLDVGLPGPPPVPPQGYQAYLIDSGMQP